MNHGEIFNTGILLLMIQTVQFKILNSAEYVRLRLIINYYETVWLNIYYA